MSQEASSSASAPAVRLARPDDIWQLAVIDVASFIGEDACAYLYTDGRQHIPAHIQYMLEKLVGIFQEKDKLITLVEAPYKANESSVLDIFMPYVGRPSPSRPAEGTEVPVAYAVWTWNDDQSRDNIKKLSEVSQTTDQDFVQSPKEVEWPPENEEHWAKYTEKVEEMYDKHLNHCDVDLYELAVHPAYQRQGYGAALMKWGMALCDSNNFPIGVDTVGKRHGLYKSLGFEVIENWSLPADASAPNGLEGCAMKWQK